MKSVKIVLATMFLLGSLGLVFRSPAVFAATNGTPMGGGKEPSCEKCKKVVMGKSCKDIEEGETGTTECKGKYEGGGVVSCSAKGKACSKPKSAVGTGGVVMF